MGRAIYVYGEKNNTFRGLDPDKYERAIQLLYDYAAWHSIRGRPRKKRRERMTSIQRHDREWGR